MVSNPYTSAIEDLPDLLSGSKKGLDAIYKAMRSNLTSFGKRLNTADATAAKGIATEYGNLDKRFGGMRQESLDAVLAHASEFGNEQDAALMKELGTIATDDIGEYQGYATSQSKAQASYQKSLRGIDKQYVRDLMASAVRERQARHGELEENFLNLSSGLQTQGAMFDAQNQLLGFAQSQLAMPTTGPVGAGPSSNMALGQQIASQFGWTGAEWEALNQLVMKESGWRNTVKNPTSSAYGIGQFLDSTWGPYGSKTSDPRLQITYMLRYIQERYGSPSRALAFHNRNNWY